MLADLRGRIDLIIDAGPCTVGVESTIVSCVEQPTLLRPGGIPRDAIERILGGTLAMPAVAEDAPTRARDADIALRAEGGAAPRR